MDENYDTYDIDLSEDDDKVYKNKIVIDVPSTAISGLSDINSTLPAWDSSAIRAASASLSDTCRRLSESIQPALATGLYASAVSESMSNSMSRIAESIKPLVSTCAMEGMTTAAERLRDSIALSPALTEAIRPAAVESISSMAKSLCSTIALDSSVTAALGNSLQAQTSIVESVKPLIESSAMEGITSVAESAKEMLAANTAISESCAGVANAAIEAIGPSLTESVKPARSVLDLFAGPATISFDISGITSAISKLFDFRDMFAEMFERMRETFSRITEMMRAVWETAGQSLSGLAHLLFHYLYHVWQNRPRFLALPWHNKIQYAAAFVNIGLSPPGQVREYVVRIRQRYLLKHQRKSDESEDLNDSFSLVYVTP